MVELERKDIQGIVVSAYKHLHCAAFLLLRVRNAQPARTWLAQVVTEVMASEAKNAALSINIAFTYSGLKSLGLGQDALDAFSLPFQEGMAAPYRARLLGDNEENAPAGWDWGAPNNPVDVLWMIYGKDEATLNAACTTRAECFAVWRSRTGENSVCPAATEHPRTFWL